MGLPNVPFCALLVGSKNPMEDMVQTSGQGPIHRFDQSSNSMFSGKFFLIVAVVVLLGIGGGYLLTVGSRSAGVLSSSSNSKSAALPKGTVEGSDDLKTFRDTAEGVLQEGGVEGEGQYHLVRPGGKSQNVYVTSSIVDLSKYVNLKIKVWGQTNAAQTAGWLMDVGKVEVLE